jgi:hypothetical protein
MDEPNIEEGVCPRCKAAYVVPIVYGDPTPEAVKGAQEAKVVLGGYLPPDESAPNLHCYTCGYEWRSEELL